MQDLNQYSSQSLSPTELEQVLRKARVMRSEAANQMVKSTFQAGSKMIREFMSSGDRASKI